MILGIIVLIVVLAGAWYLLLGPGASGRESDQPGQIDVNIELRSPAPAAS